MNNCSNLNKVRTNIDRIDNEIVKSIDERSFYVIEAAKFKNNSQEVKAPKLIYY